MAKETKGRRNTNKSAVDLSPRGWTVSLLWAAVVVGIAIGVSAAVNPLFDRSVHWDWMAAVAPAGFIALTVALRKRWV